MPPKGAEEEQLSPLADQYPNPIVDRFTAAMPRELTPGVTNPKSLLAEAYRPALAAFVSSKCRIAVSNPSRDPMLQNPTTRPS